MSGKFTWLFNLTRQQKSKRQRILRNIISLLLLFVFILILLTAWILSGFKEQRIKDDIKKNIATVTESFHESIESIEKNLTVMSKWGTSGSINLVLNDLEELNSRFIPLIEETDLINSIMIIERDSLVYQLKRTENKWLGRNFNLNDGEAFQELEQEELFILREAKNRFVEIVDSTLKEEKIFWFDSNPEDTNNLLCLTLYDFECSEIGNITNLLVLSIDKEKLENTIAVENNYDGGIVRIIAKDSEYYPSQLQDKTSVDVKSLIDTTVGDNNLLVKAMRQYARQNSHGNEPFSFYSDSQLWWATVDEVNFGMLQYKFIYLQSQSILNSKNTKDRNFYAMVGIILTLIGITFLLMIIRIYNRDIASKENIVSDPKEDLAKIIQQGEGDNLEFKSTLRWNLKANKPTRDIELAVVKTIVAFLNTEGGMLLIGIADDGSALGIEKDNFLNNDKFLLHFNNMIKAYIGLEYAGLINFYISKYEEKDILIVKCQQAKEPIFLKYEDSEDFYIRLGPGSRKLSTKKAIKYINDRKSVRG